MDDEELLELSRELESDRAERRERDDRLKIGQAICAFANDMPDNRVPGVIFVGMIISRSLSRTKII